MPDPVIIVSGLPRSGTSLVMQMLEAGGVPIVTDGERLPDQSNPRGYYEHAKVKRLKDENTWVLAHAGQAMKVVAPQIPHLPQGAGYRVLFLERDLDEVLASQDAMLGQRSSPTEREALRGHAEALLSRVRAHLDARPDCAVLPVSHAELLVRPRDTAQRINGFLSANLAVDAMASSVEPSLHRQRAT